MKDPRFSATSPKSLQSDGVVRCGSEDVPYVVVRSRRRTIALHLTREGVVEVRAPTYASRADIDGMLRRHSTWIWRTLASRRTSPPPCSYDEGGAITFLGESLTLRLRAGLPRRAVREGGDLVVTLPPPLPNPDATRELVYGWFAEQGRALFPERLARCRALAEDAGLALPPVRSLTVRAMGSRWGSCSYTGHVTLNSMLLQAPLETVDYVVMHELCHLLEQNHSSRFYALLDRTLPGWRPLRRSLRSLEALP